MTKTMVSPERAERISEAIVRLTILRSKLGDVDLAAQYDHILATINSECAGTAELFFALCEIGSIVAT